MILSDPTSQVLSFFADKNPTSCVNILLVFRSYRVIRVSAHAHGFCPGAQVQPEAPYFESSAPIFPSAHEISLPQGLSCPVFEGKFMHWGWRGKTRSPTGFVNNCVPFLFTLELI